MVELELRRGLWRVFALLALSAALGPVLAEPTEPALQEIDAGPAVPTSPYLSYLIAGANQPGVVKGLTFPIVTRLVSGRLQRPGTAVLDARWLTQPVFLLASDESSLEWLSHNAAALRQMDAAGIVMAAADAAAFKRVQKLAAAQMLPVAPGPDHWLEEQLLRASAGVLPVLIRVDGHVMQEFGP